MLNILWQSWFFHSFIKAPLLCWVLNSNASFLPTRAGGKQAKPLLGVQTFQSYWLAQTPSVVSPSWNANTELNNIILYICQKHPSDCSKQLFSRLCHMLCQAKHPCIIILCCYLKLKARLVVQAEDSSLDRAFVLRAGIGSPTWSFLHVKELIANKGRIFSGHFPAKENQFIFGKMCMNNIVFVLHR